MQFKFLMGSVCVCVGGGGGGFPWEEKVPNENHIFLIMKRKFKQRSKIV